MSLDRLRLGIVLTVNGGNFEAVECGALTNIQVLAYTIFSSKLLIFFY